jgi:hypothetical protein
MPIYPSGGGAATAVVTAYATGSQLTIIGTEHFLANVLEAGKFRLSVDLNPMAAGDVVELRIYQMVLTGGTPRVIGPFCFYGAQITDSQVVETPDVWNELTDAQSLRFSLTQTFGAVRTFDWKVLKG